MKVNIFGSDVGRVSEVIDRCNERGPDSGVEGILRIESIWTKGMAGPSGKDRKGLRSTIEVTLGVVRRHNPSNLTA